MSAEEEDFLGRHPYSTEMLESLPTEKFIKKWRMLLKWQDDSKVVNAEAEVHRSHFVEARAIFQRIPPSQYPKVLDLGCGGGETEALRQLGYQATGVTLGPLNVIWAKEKYGIGLIYGDMHDLPFPADSFDAVISKESFEHCFAPVLVTIEVSHVLRPHGKWLLTQPDAAKEVGFDWGHPTILSATQRKALFENFGFRVLELREDFTLCEKLADEDVSEACLGIRRTRRVIN